MISAQNHHRQLNGNKLLLFIFIISFGLFFTSCDLFKDSRSTKRQQNKENSDYTKNKNPKFDEDPITIEKEKNDKVIDDVDGKKSSIESPDKKNKYFVDLYLPIEDQFFDDSEEQINGKNRHYLGYLNGIILSVEKMKQEGLNVSLNVKSVPENTKSISTVVKGSNMPSPDIIIGGTSTDQINALADYAAKKKVTVISPFIPRSNMTLSNPYFIQAMPDFNAHSKAIVEDILLNHKDSDVHLVGPSSVSSRFKYFQEAKRELEKTNSGREFNELIIDQSSIKTLTNQSLGNSEEQVFIIPLDRDKQYLYDLLTKLSMLEEKSRFIVYGIPPWERYDILYNLFDPLEIRVSSHYDMKLNPTEFKEFERDYIEKYNSVPNPTAAFAYDMMNVILENVHRNGVPVSKSLIEGNENRESVSIWKFNAVSPETSDGKRKGNRVIDYISNEGIIIKTYYKP